MAVIKERLDIIGALMQRPDIDVNVTDEIQKSIFSYKVLIFYINDFILDFFWKTPYKLAHNGQIKKLFNPNDDPSVFVE